MAEGREDRGPGPWSPCRPPGGLWLVLGVKWGDLQGSGEKRFHSEAPLDILERNNGDLAYSGGCGDCENPEDSGELLKVEPTRNAGRLCGWQNNGLPKIAFPNPQAYELLPSLARGRMN